MEEACHVLYLLHGATLHWLTYRSECERMALKLFDMWYTKERTPSFSLRHVQFGKFTIERVTQRMKNKFEKMRQGATPSLVVPDTREWVGVLDQQS